MGLFILPAELQGEAEENVRRAEANLKLFWEDPTRNAYLLSFAVACLERARIQLDLQNHAQK